MNVIRTLGASSLTALLALAGFSLAACDKPTAPKQAASDSGHSHDDHDHDHGDADHSHDESTNMAGHHSGIVVELGEQTANGYTVRASRDGGVVAGGDAPVDVWVSGGAPVAAVRFWIGIEDGAGSMKARAEIEGDHWHTHTDVPNPMPEGSRLWVEVEAEDGTKTVVGFDLKA